MTPDDIYQNFKIEYDKLSDISNYPSLTLKEIQTILNKAYLALIAQKLTGNNPRNVGFEGDNKAIEDIRPLLNTIVMQKQNKAGTIFDEAQGYIQNAEVYKIINNYRFLYYIESNLHLTYQIKDTNIKQIGIANVKLVTHEIAQKYMYTVHNKPWIEQPVCYIEGDNIIVLIDERHTAGNLLLTYIKKPIMFGEEEQDGDIIFELSDTVAEELINLAIVLGAETVESPRQTTRQNLRPLES